MRGQETGFEENENPGRGVSSYGTPVNVVVADHIASRYYVC